MISEDDIPDNWKLTNISEVSVEMNTGSTPRRSTDENWGGDIKWAKAGEISSAGKYISETEERVTEKASQNTYGKNYVFVTIIGANLGSVVLPEDKMGINQQNVSIKLSEDIDREYFYHYIQNIEKYLQELGRGGGQQAINQTILGDVPIPVPPLPEQQEIVEKIEQRLEAVDRLSRGISRLTELTREYEYSLLAFLFAGKKDLTSEGPDSIPTEQDIPDHWELKTVEKIGKVVTGGTPETDVKEYWNGDIPWIRVSDLDGSKYVNNSEDKITEEGLKSGACSLLPEGSVVLSTRATIGKVAITGTKLATNQGFKSIVPKPEMSSEFLFYYLVAIRRYIKSLGKGATYDEVSKTQIQNIAVPVPPIDEQEDIVRQIESVDFKRVSRAVDDVNELFEEYRNSVLSHAFTQPSNRYEKTAVEQETPPKL